MWYPYATIRIAKPRSIDNTRCWRDVNQQEPSLTVGENAYMAQPLWKTDGKTREGEVDSSVFNRGLKH